MALDWCRCRAPGQGRGGRFGGPRSSLLRWPRGRPRVWPGRRAEPTRTTPAPTSSGRRSLIRAGDLPSAERSLEACVAAAPAERGSLAHAGPRSLRASGTSTRPRPRLEKSLELDARQPQAFKMLGRVHTARSKPALAERAFVEAARLDPADAEARYLLGRLYQSEDRLVEASRFLKEAVALDPGSVRALAFLGSVSYALGDDGALPGVVPASRVPEPRPRRRPTPFPTSSTGSTSSAPTAWRRASPSCAGRRSSTARASRPGSSWAGACYRLRRLEEAGEALREALALDASRPARALPPRPGLLRAGRPRLRGRAHEAVGEAAEGTDRAMAARGSVETGAPAGGRPGPRRSRRGPDPVRGRRRGAPGSATSSATPRRPSGTRSSP